MTKEPIQYIINDPAGSYTLQYSPEGWDKTDVKLMRSEKYRAINKSISETGFKFVKDGRAILLKNLCLYGIQAECSLTINTLNTVTQEYELLGTYDFDFSTYELIKDFIVVTLKRGGLIEKVNAREGNVYELPEIQTHAEKVVVTMVLPNLQESRDLSINEQPEIPNYLHPTDNAATDIPNKSFYVGSSQYADEIQTFATAQFDREWMEFNGIIDVTKYFLQNNANCKQLRFTIDISGHYIPMNPSANFRLLLVDGFGGNWNNVITLFEGTNRHLAVSAPFPPNYYDLTVNMVFDIPVTSLNINEWHLLALDGYLAYDYEDPDVANGWAFAPSISGTIKIESLSSPGTKIINALPAKTVFKELMRAIDETTPGYPTIQSYLLDAFNNILLTSGDALRGLDGGLKTSFNDFFKFCDVVFGGCGFKVDDSNKAILESIFNFYPDTQIADLGEVSNLSIKPWQQFFSSALNIGYKDVNIDNGSINGKFAYNTAQNYTLPITKVEKVEDLICPYQADPMAITLTAINRENKTTTDSSQDNDVFILVTKSTGVGTAELERDNDYINAPTGFPDEAGAFNTLITPKRLLLYRGRMLSAMLNKLETENIVFNSTNKNKEFISRRTTETANIVEKDNVLISTLLPKLFNPELIECEAPITKQTIAALSTVDGYLAFTYKGVALKGYIYDIGYEADRINKFKLTLISHKDNDYSNL